MAIYFVVFNGVVYAFEVKPQDALLVPAHQSSRYKDEFKDLIDDAITDLAGKPNGKYGYSKKYKRWHWLQLSFSELFEIAKNDASAMDSVRLDTPMKPLLLEEDQDKKRMSTNGFYSKA